MYSIHIEYNANKTHLNGFDARVSYGLDDPKLYYQKTVFWFWSICYHHPVSLLLLSHQRGPTIGTVWINTGMPRIPWQFVVIKFSVAILILQPFKGTMLSLLFLNMSSCVVFSLQGQWNNLGLHCIMKEKFYMQLVNLCYSFLFVIKSSSWPHQRCQYHLIAEQRLCPFHTI